MKALNYVSLIVIVFFNGILPGVIVKLPADSIYWWLWVIPTDLLLLWLTVYLNKQHKEN